MLFGRLVSNASCDVADYKQHRMRH